MEKFLFPMQYYTLTQGYGSNSYSHKSSLALDFGGKDHGIDAVYAPFTGTIKKIYTSSNIVWIESNGNVLCADGKDRKLVMLLAHDNNISDLKVGKVIAQGQKFYDEGTKGLATGNHIHIEVGSGPFSGSGWHLNSAGKWQINNPLAPEKLMMYAEGTVVKNTIYLGKDYGLKWARDVNPPAPAPIPEPTPEPTPPAPVPEPAPIQNDEINPGDTVIVNGVGTANNMGGGSKTGKYVNRTMKVIDVSHNPTRTHPLALNQWNEGIPNINGSNPSRQGTTAWFKKSDVKKI